MQDSISITSLKRTKHSSSEKQILELAKITKHLGTQNDMIKRFLSLYTRNELQNQKQGESKKPTLSDSFLKPHFQIAPIPYLTQVISINPNKILPLDKTQEAISTNPNKILPLDKTQEAPKPKRKPITIICKSNSTTISNSIFNSRARLNTSYMEAKFSRPQKPYDLWKLHNHIHIDAKVFVIAGNYPDLRAALLRRGWIENKSHDSIFFDLKWARSARVPSSLADWQLFNHFPRNSQLTAKWNLCKNLNKQISNTTEKSSLGYFPRCYKLNNKGFHRFSNYYKITHAVGILKESIGEPFRHHFEKLASAIQIGKRWIDVLKGQARDEELDIIMNHDWRILCTNDHRTIGSYYARCLQGENLQALCEKNIEELAVLDPQFFINGTKNIWIVKPGHKSRGRDISIHANIRDIYDYTDSPDLCVVQKYIENPLLINLKKFDIRQWVLVTNDEPLVVWVFKECYLRFTIKDYSSDELSNLYAHLTNNSISKKSKEFQKAEIQGCMWSLNSFKEFLMGEYGFNAWEEKIYPEIKHIVKRSLLAVGSLGRKNSFELLGYDFMIDSNLTPWLLEINSSPALDYSTVRII